MTRIEQLRKRFAAGMAEGKISAEDWEEEFLPMIADAEKWRNHPPLTMPGLFSRFYPGTTTKETK